MNTKDVIRRIDLGSDQVLPLTCDPYETIEQRIIRYAKNLLTQEELDKVKSCSVWLEYNGAEVVFSNLVKEEIDELSKR